METTGDKWRAIAFSLALHVAVGVALFVRLLAPPAAAQDAAGSAIEASLVNSPQQAASLAKEIRALERKDAQDETPAPRQPRPQDSPRPQQMIPQAQLPKPDTVDQDEVRKLAEQQALEKRQHEQEERRKQAQIDLDRKQEQQQEEIRQRQIAMIEKQRADAQRQMKLHEQALRQLHDQQTQLALNNAPPVVAPAVPPRARAGNNGKQQDATAAYIQAIKDTVEQYWRPDRVPELVHCQVTFIQERPTGEIKDVIFGDCPYDADARATIEALKGTLLPYEPYKNLFQREVRIDMCYPTEKCTR